MRIIQGQLKGLPLPYIKGDHRPLTAKAREWLFQYLGSIENKTFLDLFAGTGIVSLEAISSGASPTAVERDAKTVLQVRNFLKKQEISIHYIVKPVEAFIKQEKQSFDIVFLDPPFAYKYKSDLLRRVFSSSIVVPTTTVIIHTPKKEDFVLNPSISCVKEKLFGFSYLRAFAIKDTAQ